MSRGAEKENRNEKRVLLKQRYQPKSTGHKEYMKTQRFAVSFTDNILKLFFREPGLIEICFTSRL